MLHRSWANQDRTSASVSAPVSISSCASGVNRRLTRSWVVSVALSADLPRPMSPQPAQGR